MKQSSPINNAHPVENQQTLLIEQFQSKVDTLLIEFENIKNQLLMRNQDYLNDSLVDKVGLLTNVKKQLDELDAGAENEQNQKSSQLQSKHSLYRSNADTISEGSDEYNQSL